MGWFTGCVLYALIWWIALFGVLPLWVQTEDAPDALTGWRGLPKRALLRRKIVVTTVVAAVIWLALVGLIESPLLSFRHGWMSLPAP